MPCSAPYAGSVNQMLPSEWTTTSLGELKGRAWKEVVRREAGWVVEVVEVVGEGGRGMYAIPPGVERVPWAQNKMPDL